MKFSTSIIILTVVISLIASCEKGELNIGPPWFDGEVTFKVQDNPDQRRGVADMVYPPLIQTDSVVGLYRFSFGLPSIEIVPEPFSIDNISDTALNSGDKIKLEFYDVPRFLRNGETPKPNGSFYSAGGDILNATYNTDSLGSDSWVQALEITDTEIILAFELNLIRTRLGISRDTLRFPQHMRIREGLIRTKLPEEWFD